MNVPKLRFKEFTDSYKKMKYKDVLKIKSGKDQKRIECKNGKYPILGTGGKIGTTNMFLYNKPSVLIGRKGTINKPQYMETPFWTVDTLFYSQIYKPNIPKYLFYSFQNVNWQKYDESTGVPSLSSSTIESVECFIPSIDEQIKVSKFLSLLDKKIELQTKKIEALKLFKKGLFDTQLENNGKESIMFDNFLYEVTEKSSIQNQYPVLSSTSKGLFLQSDYFNKQASSENNVGYKILKRNQLVLSPQNLWMGNININNIFDIGIVSPSYRVYNIDIKKIDLNYFNYWIKTPKALYCYLISSEQGASIVRRNLNIEMFNQISLKIPNLEKQHIIGNKIYQFNLKINFEEEKLKQLHKLKKALLQNMFI